MDRLERQCAWCKKGLDVSTASFEGERPVTHGMCPQCNFHVRATMGMALQEFIEGLAAPLLIMGDEGKVVCANKAAQTMLGKNASKIDGFKGGEVFECEYAYLPEGCGRTVHCSGCTIRIAVMDTLRTGKGHCRLLAFLNKRSTGKIELHISTEKIGQFVLLRID